MMSKRPSFQFYPSDWLRDTALRSCSIGARGLWMDMICYMHEGNPYGYLKVGDKVILPDNLARMVGQTLPEVEGWLSELSQAGVYDLIDGAIVSRRMVKDENLRNIRALGGKLGGNPALMDKDKVNLKVGKEVKQKPTPSSSSSSSSSNIFIDEEKPKKKVATKETELADDYSPKETHFELAKQLNVNVNAELLKFSDYHKSRGNKFKSWDFAFNTWLRNASDFKRPNVSTPAFDGRLRGAK
jgi:hypothetical protein